MVSRTETYTLFFSFQFSLVNSTNLLELTRELISEAINFTNKKLYYSYLKRLFITGVRLLSPVNQTNDMMAFNFSRVSKGYFFSIISRNAGFEKRHLKLTVWRTVD